MPKTIIKIRTWRCTGFPGCNYGQEAEPTKENMDRDFNADKRFGVSDVKENECPSCALKGKRGVQMERMTDPARMKEMTVMGVEDIEEEIDERNETLYRSSNTAAIDERIDWARKNNKIKTDESATEIRDRGIKSLDEEIAAKKTRGFYLTTKKAVDTYRTKRRKDMVDAIARAKTYEDN